MADAVTLAFRDRHRRAVLGQLTLDASVKETVQADVDVTDHPVESGPDISDHARPKPVQITIEGVIASAPIYQGSDATFQRDTDQQFPMGDFARPHEAYRILSEMREAGEPVTVVCNLGEFPNMIMTSLSIPRDASTADKLHFTATFKKIVIVTSQTVAVPTSTKSTQGKTKGGKKDAKAATPAIKQSTLAKGEDWWKSGGPGQFFAPLKGVFGF